MSSLYMVKALLVGLRKTMAVWGFTILAAVLLIYGFVPGETWLEHMKTVMIAYFSANAGEHLSKTLIDKYYGSNK